MTTRAIDAVIFDLDGTLVDSLGDIASAINHVLAERALPTHPVSRIADFVGEGAAVLAKLATPPDHHGRLDDIIAAFAKHYGEHLLISTKPYDGITTLLDTLEQTGTRLAVLSNKPHAMVGHIVAELFAAHFGDNWAGQQACIPKKPDPTAALSMAQTLGVSPAQCAFVGDTAIDMRTASAAGMLPVGVTWGFRGREELLEAGAAALLDRPAGLLAIVGR